MNDLYIMTQYIAYEFWKAVSNITLTEVVAIFFVLLVMFLLICVMCEENRQINKKIKEMKEEERKKYDRPE